MIQDDIFVGDQTGKVVAKGQINEENVLVFERAVVIASAAAISFHGKHNKIVARKT